VHHYAVEMLLGGFLFAADFTGIFFLNRQQVSLTFSKNGLGNFV
jgi:hypothetical protein